MTNYPKRLIEVDLPIARISAHARREKSIRHGHISTLHIWWARRPLAACRAVICAALWPDPADPLCPQPFRDAAVRLLTAFARKVVGKGEKIGSSDLKDTASRESFACWELISNPASPLDPGVEAHQNLLRFALLDFIADFANWDNSTVPEYLETARGLTQAAHEALGGEPGTRPLVVDPFAGGGSIPLEALRVGADAFASDLNPVAVLLNKVVLEYIPKYGQRLADEVRKWGKWVKEQAEKELAEFYPKDPDGATPIAYLWARTIRCEGAGCGAEVPLIRSLWLAKKGNKSVALRLVPRPKLKRVDFEIVENATVNEVGEGTVKRGSATCPVCGFTTPITSVRRQLKERSGGAADARLFCVVTSPANEQGRAYRSATTQDTECARRAANQLDKIRSTPNSLMSVIPDERFTGLEPRRIPVPQYGMEGFGDLFAPRQMLFLVTLVKLCQAVGARLRTKDSDGLPDAVQACIAFVSDRQANTLTALSRWNPAGEKIEGLFSRQAIPMLWDFAEAIPFAGSTGGFDGAVAWVAEVCESGAAAEIAVGSIQAASATEHPLPDGAADAVITDPPYYYSVPYSDLSDFFYVWLRRSLNGCFPELLASTLTPKDRECVQNLPHSEVAKHQKDRRFYEAAMHDALSETCRITKHGGIGAVVFAHSDTDAWESLLGALIGGGWCVTASWPIDTERGGRMIAQRQSVLASSVHLVCRPRAEGRSGDWRDVLSELPKRMHEWMPRLASEGVVGADAIFACLGPALEVFSRYSRVEKASGEPVTLKEYLEHVWAAVSKEALSVIFRDADAAGLDPDARLTAMWLWTLGGGAPAAKGNGKSVATGEEEDGVEEDEGGSKPAATSGYILEFDAARKIAQGLGVHLERSESIVEVKGDKARLLPVSERTRHLFGKGAEDGPSGDKRGKKRPKQGSLFEELGEAEAADGGRMELKGPTVGTTALDRLHQAMILFGVQRGELLKRFLIEDGVGKDARFWKLAQSLSALYPPGTDEKRWVDGVLARKKGLGL